MSSKVIGQRSSSKDKNAKNEPKFNNEKSVVELVKTIEQSKNTTEFLMLTLQSALNYEPQQVQELLTNQNQYLLQACDKGILGDHQPIIVWFRLLIHHLPVMVELFKFAYAKKSSVEVTLVLNSIRSGLYSQNQTVVILALEVIERVADQLFQELFVTGLQVKSKKNKKNSIIEVKVPIFTQYQDWFMKPMSSTKVNVPRYMRDKAQKTSQNADPNSILRILCGETIEIHPTLAKNITKTLLAVFKDIDEPGIPQGLSLDQFPEKLIEVFSDDIFLAYSCLSQIIPELRKIDRGILQHLIINSSLIPRLLDSACESTQDHAVRLQASTLLIDIWYDESTALCNIQNHKTQIYEVITQGILHKDKVFKITILGSIFSLLDNLLVQKSPESPRVFKTLIDASTDLLKQRKDRITEEFLFKNLVYLFNNHYDVFLASCIEPILTEIIDRLKKKQFTSEEISFLTQIAKHPKLNPQTAFMILEIFAVGFVGKPTIALTLIQPISDLVHKFQNSSNIIVFVETILITKALSQIILLRQNQIVPNKQALMITYTSSQPSSLRQQYNSNTKRNNNEIMQKLVRYQMVHLVECLAELKIPSIEQAIQDQIKPLKQKYENLFKQESSAYNYLIRKLNLVFDAMSEEIPESGKSLALVPLPDNYELQLLEEKRESEKQKIDQKYKQRSQLWQKAKDPKNDIALRAIEEIYMLKEKRLQKQQADRIEELKKSEQEQKLHDSTQQHLLMSKLIAEKEAKVRKNEFREKMEGTKQIQPFYEHILNTPVLPQPISDKLSQNELQLLQQLRVPKDGIFIVNFEYDEEDRERDMMRIMVYNNQSLFLNLFKKYAQKDSIGILEIQKFIKDYGIELTSKEVQVFLKLIKDLFLNRSLNLEFQGFVQFIIQTSIYLHRKGRVQGVIQDSFMMMGAMLFNTMKQIQDYGNRRAEKLEIFKDKIQSQKIQTQFFIYRIPDSVVNVIGVARSYALEILNELIQKQFDFSFLESIAVDKIPAPKKQQDAKKGYKEVRSSLDSDKQKGKKKLIQKKMEDSFITQSSGTKTKKINFVIYSAKLLAEKVKKPIKERRNPYRDNENEEKLLQMQVGQFVKVACFELQQVRPQSDLDEMREIACLLEDMLIATSDPKKKYVPQKIEKPVIKQRSKHLEEQVYGTKLAEIEQAKKQELKKEKEKKNELFLRKVLKEPQELEMKELLALRAKHVIKNIQQSQQKYQERIQRISRNGDGAKINESQSQKVLKKSNSNQEIIKRAKKVQSSLTTIQKVQLTPLQKIPQSKQMDPLQFFYIQKEVQDVFSSYKTQLQAIFKERCEFDTINNEDAVVLKFSSFDSIMAERNFGPVNVFRQVCGYRTECCITFEEFKKSMIPLSLIDQNIETPDMKSYQQVLTNSLIKNNGLNKFLRKFTKASEIQSHEVQLEHELTFEPDNNFAEGPIDLTIDNYAQNNTDVLDQSENLFDDYRLSETPRPI